MKTNLQNKFILIGLIIFNFISMQLFSQGDWVKYEGPVISETPWSTHAFYPAVLHDEGVYKMWFSAYIGGYSSIGYAKSDDGIEWKINNLPVIYGNVGGAWQEDKGAGTVLRVNDTLKMWYTGSSDNFDIELAIGYAYYDESIGEWNINSNPVLDKGLPNSWDAQGVLQPAVYYDGSTYQMWYHGFENPDLWAPCGIGHATSSDGINWTKDSINNPVMIPDSGTFYSTWNMSNYVLYRLNESGEYEYQLWFSGWDGIVTPFRMKIGYATSSDGIDWTVENDDSCVLDLGPAGSWDSRQVRMATVQHFNDTLRMWYGGINETSFGFSNFKIGYAWCYAPDINTGTREFGFTEQMHIIISPNPCTDVTKLQFRMPVDGNLNINLYDISGQKIKRLLNEVKMPGEYEIEIDVRDLPPGVYFIRMQAGDQVVTEKLVVM